jgi:hypothetical protein
VHTLEQAITMIEELTGEEMTPEEIEELREVFENEQYDCRELNADVSARNQS